MTSGKRRYQERLSDVREKQFSELWSTNEKNDLDFVLWPWNATGFLRLPKCMFAYVQRFMSYRAQLRMH